MSGRSRPDESRLRPSSDERAEHAHVPLGRLRRRRRRVRRGHGGAAGRAGPRPVAAARQLRRLRCGTPSASPRRWCAGVGGSAAPGPDVARGTDEFVAVGWDAVLDRLAAELPGSYGGAGPEAVFGGSYGWSSAGRFHHAQSQVHRFLNCLGGYVRSVNTYSIGTSEVVLPRIFGRRGDLLRSLTAWPLIAAHTELLVCFGGIPAKNLAVAPGGVTRHRSVGHLAEMVRRGGEVVLAGPDRATTCRRALGPVAAAAARHRRRADAGAVPRSCRRGPARPRFLATHCAGADEALAYLDGSADGVEKSPQWAAAICGVPAEDDRRAGPRDGGPAHDGHGELVAAARRARRAAGVGGRRCWPRCWAGSGCPAPGSGTATARWPTSAVPVDGVGPPTLPQLVNPVAQLIPVARIADMLLSPGSRYTYNGERRRYPYIRARVLERRQPVPPPPGPGPAAQGVPGREHGGRARAVLDGHGAARRRRAPRHRDAGARRHRRRRAPTRTSPRCTGTRRRTRRPATTTRSSRPGRAPGRRPRRSPRAATPTGLAAPYLRAVARRAAAAPPRLRQFWADGRCRAAVPADDCSSRDFRADPAAHPLATPSGRIELFSATIAGFGYADCPGHPAWLEPGEWHGAAAGRATTRCVLLANNPSRAPAQPARLRPAQRGSKVAGREPLRMHPDDAAARGLADGRPRAGVQRPRRLPGGPARVRRPAARAWSSCRRAPGSPRWRTRAARRCCARRATSTCSPPTSARRASRRAARGPAALVEVQRWEGAVPPVASAGPPPVRGD